MHATALLGALAGVVLAASALHGQVAHSVAPLEAGVESLLARVGNQVEQFFLRAQRLVCLERVSLQPLTSSFSPSGLPRTIESELRLSWNPDDGEAATEAHIERKVLEVNGRPPREDDPNNCTTPEQQDTEPQPLSMLLPAQRERYEFRLADRTRLDGREAIVIDFRERGPISTDVRLVEGRDDCISYDVTGGERGRIWIDASTFDVLRLDQRISGMIDLRLPREATRRPGSSLFLTLERSDTSIRFTRVAFRDPDESIVLPRSSIALRIVRGSGTPRLRTVTQYLDYKRFLTGGRVVPPPPR